MGLHHATLKAAVALYAILLTQGKTEAEIKEAISSDEKEFKASEVEEIYAAILEQSKADHPSADQPDWVAKVIASNEAVIISNQAVIEAVEAFSNSFVHSSSPQELPVMNIQLTDDFDPEIDYVVAEGKSFRHPNDFSKEFKSGAKVNGLAIEKLKSLYGQGLIEKA